MSWQYPSLEIQWRRRQLFIIIRLSSSIMSWIWGAKKQKKCFQTKKKGKYCFGGKLLCRPKNLAGKALELEIAVVTEYRVFLQHFVRLLEALLWLTLLYSLLHSLHSFTESLIMYSFVMCTPLWNVFCTLHSFHSALYFTLHSFAHCTLFYSALFFTLHSITLWTLLYSALF